MLKTMFSGFRNELPTTGKRYKPLNIRWFYNRIIESAEYKIETAKTKLEELSKY